MRYVETNLRLHRITRNLFYLFLNLKQKTLVKPLVAENMQIKLTMMTVSVKRMLRGERYFHDYLYFTQHQRTQIKLYDCLHLVEIKTET